MDRRTAISRLGIMLGGMLTASTLSALVSGCQAPPASDFRPQLLDDDQLDLLARIAEAIIPETDTPGARAAGVHRFIDTMLAEYYRPEDSSRFLSALDGWVANLDLAGMTDEQLVAVLSEADAAWASGQEDPVWARLKEWTISGYYTSEIGMTQELRLMPYTQARMDIPRSDVERTWAT